MLTTRSRLLTSSSSSWTDSTPERASSSSVVRYNLTPGILLLTPRTAATNFPESLDKALVRPGRFDRHIVVPLPDVRGRMSILQHHMRNVGYDKKLVDISMIARGTIGFSGADLQADRKSVV